VFKDRTRFTKPGRCPRCKGGHLEQPRYEIIQELYRGRGGCYAEGRCKTGEL
jgi:hypothetical protein